MKGKDAKAGQHTIVIGPGQLGQMFAANIMRPDPSHKYVLVSADQNGALNAADIGNPPQAEFRIWLLGAVTRRTATAIRARTSPGGVWIRWLPN